MRTHTLALFAVGVLMACGQRNEPVSRADRGADLGGSAWTLLSIDGTPAIQGTEVTLQLDNGEAGGFGGCNSFGAKYVLEGDAIRIDSIVSTMRACLDDRLMQQEAAYYGAIDRVSTYRVSGDSLVLGATGSPSLLVFRRRSE